MGVVVHERTPAIAAALNLFMQHELSESGKPVDHRLVGETGRDDILLTTGLTSNSRRILGAGGGVFVLSAHPVLEQLGALVKEGAPCRIATFGCHACSRQERVMLGQGLQVYSMLEISREGIGESTDAAMLYVRRWPGFHLVIDLSVLDAAFVACGTPGGLTSRELLYVVQRLCLVKSLQGCELLFREADERAASLCARIAAECSTLGSQTDRAS